MPVNGLAQEPAVRSLFVHTAAALKHYLHEESGRRNGLPETITIDEPVADGAVFYRPRPRSPSPESAGAAPGLVARG